MVNFLIKQNKHIYIERREKKFERNMDMENIRQVLEDAAQTFLSAANTITNERRREAEKVIEIIFRFHLKIFFLF